MKIINLGLRDYAEVYQIQKSLVEDIYLGKEEPSLIVCSHPSVVTLGKKSTQQDTLGWSGSFFEIERGGQATYHGPGQIIIYPIINLKNYSQNIGGYLESLERSMILTLENIGLSASGNNERGRPDFTGVWVNHKKIASIGIAVKRWITYHGLAFNLNRDPNFFKGINPCGFSSETMTSLEDLLKECPDREFVENSLTKNLIDHFSQL